MLQTGNKPCGTEKFSVFNPSTPGKLQKNGTFKQPMAFFSPV